MTKDPMPIPIKALADYIIRYLHDKGMPITNNKLQNLLYYSQGWHLVLYGLPLFKEELQAWVQGPVQPKIFDDFKHYGQAPIGEPYISMDIKRPEMSRVVEFALDAFGILESEYELSRRVRKEDPWLNSRGNIPHDEECTNVISREEMFCWFSRNSSLL